MIKVLHLSSASSWRGGEQQIAYLVTELNSMGLENFVFCPIESPLSKWCEKENINHRTYRRGSSVSFPTSRQLKRTVSDLKIDLVHIHDSHSHNYAWLASSIFGNKVPLVLSRRVDFPISYSSTRKYNFKDIKKIICVSDYVKNIVSNRIRDKSKLITIHDGIELFNPTNSDFLRKKFNISKNTLLVGNVAAIADHKDYFTFVDTAAIVLKEALLDIKFIMIGEDGGDLEAIRKYISEKNLQDHIIEAGFIPNAKLYINELDLFLFTSKTEGLGSSLLDAFQSGVPVVSTNAGGIPEIVKHEKTGLLSETHDARQLANHILRLLQDSMMKDTIVSNAKEFVKSLSKNEMANKTADTYHKLLKEK